jgi:hypothetical protein
MAFPRSDCLMWQELPTSMLKWQMGGGEMSVLSMIQEIEENTDVRFDEMNKNLIKKMGLWNGYYITY